MAAATTPLEKFLNPPNPLTKRDRRCPSFSVRFEPVLTPHSTTTRRSWTNTSAIVVRNTIIINVSPSSKLRSQLLLLGTCSLSLDPIHRSWFNSRLVVAVPGAFASSAAKQDDDEDEHEKKKKKKKKKQSTTADNVENEKKMMMISSSSDDHQNIKEVVLLQNAAEEEEEEESPYWNWNWNWNWRQIISRMLQVNSLFKEYLISADDNKSPEEVIKDIVVETFGYSSSSTPEHHHHHLIKDAASNKLEDFHLGIPYGALLSLGGFLSFMITGNISGIRFGVILGGTLLALSISSLRCSYATTPLQQQQQAIMKLGQAAIAGIIFLRHLGLLFQRPSFPNSFTALISGGMVVFYLYTIMLDGGVRKKKKKNRSELA